MISLRPCARSGCGALIPSTSGDGRALSPAEYRNRKYCSRACTGVDSRKIPLASRLCERDGCGRPFERRKGQSCANFMEQRFCSHACSTAGREPRAPKPRVTERRPTRKPDPMAGLPTDLFADEHEHADSDRYGRFTGDGHRARSLTGCAAAMVAG